MRKSCVDFADILCWYGLAEGHITWTVGSARWCRTHSTGWLVLQVIRKEAKEATTVPWNSTANKCGPFTKSIWISCVQVQGCKGHHSETSSSISFKLVASSTISETEGTRLWQLSESRRFRCPSLLRSDSSHLRHLREPTQHSFPRLKQLIRKLGGNSKNTLLAALSHTRIPRQFPCQL